MPTQRKEATTTTTATLRIIGQARWNEFTFTHKQALAQAVSPCREILFINFWFRRVLCFSRASKQPILSLSLMNRKQNTQPSSRNCPCPFANGPHCNQNMRSKCIKVHTFFYHSTVSIHRLCRILLVPPFIHELKREREGKTARTTKRLKIGDLINQ